MEYLINEMMNVRTLHPSGDGVPVLQEYPLVKVNKRMFISMI